MTRKYLLCQGILVIKIKTNLIKPSKILNLKTKIVIGPINNEDFNEVKKI